MGLNNEERRTMVGLEIEKADRFLKQAGIMCDMEQWDIAANRYYYACFHAVQALFVHNGLASRRHKGMLTQLGLHFVKPGIVEDRLGAFLTRMEQLREKGDYNCLFEVTKDELLTFVEPAKELVDKIKLLISEQ